MISNVQYFQLLAGHASPLLFVCEWRHMAKT